MPLKPLSRRTILRGAGTLLALPMLEAMLPACASKPPAKKKVQTEEYGALEIEPMSGPRRLVYFFVPSGVYLPAFVPTTTGANYELPRTLTSLKPHQNDILVLSGLTNETLKDVRNAVHSRATSAFLSCRSIRKDQVYAGTSIDQIAATCVGDQTRLPSLEIGTSRPRDGMSCDDDWTCVYADTISWANPTRPRLKDTDPRSVFDRLFAGVGKNGDAAAIDRRKLYRTSILDVVTKDAQALQARLGAGDRAHLDEYLTSIREVELRLEKLPTDSPASPIPENYDNSSLQARFSLMLDLLVLALQTDTTRIATFMHGFGLFSYVYSFLGVHTAHHATTHHNGDAGLIESVTKIADWEVAQFASLLDRMKKVKEPGGTLLDSSLVMFGSEYGDGNQHSYRDLPIIVAGKGGGLFKPGRHVAYQKGESIADLYSAMVASVGVQLPKFGDFGTGPLAGLT